MKKFGLLLGFTVLISGFVMAQSSNDHKLRNHKLNKFKNVHHETSKLIAISATNDHDHNYMKRNDKFHKHHDNTGLYHIKDKIDYDYRALNRKFNKNQNANKLSVQLRKNKLLSQN